MTYAAHSAIVRWIDRQAGKEAPTDAVLARAFELLTADPLNNATSRLGRDEAP
jgi:hypothetical protein